MATVKLHGGLGNQLFQYAVGRALSYKTSSKLYLETSTFTGTSSSNSEPASRTLQLSNFNIQGEIVHNPIDQAPLLLGRFKIFDLLSAISPEIAAQVCLVHKDLEEPHRFTPYILTMPGSTFLYGYYQSEKYFTEIRNTLRNELSIRANPTDQNREWKEQIEAHNSVGVHVRRTDYVEQEWQLPAEYYQSAIKEIYALSGDITLFFFSDKIEWVKENIERFLPHEFPVENVKCVDCNDGENAYEDLRLMKSCRHNIIANSTFSWWAAWLNQDKDKTVLAPAYWLRNRVENIDIIPQRWSIVNW